MSKTLYLAGPIGGLQYEEATGWRSVVGNLVTFPWVCLSPLRGKEFLQGAGPIQNLGQTRAISLPQGIIARDRNDVMNCDLVLMYLLGAPKISIGTMCELAWADAVRTPVIVVMEPEGNPHDGLFVRQLASYVVPDLEEALEIVAAF